MKKIKILEVTAFTAGIDGVWTRVKAESLLLAKKGFDVTVFSSNILRGTGKIELAKSFEKIGNVKIYRFPTFFNVGENAFFWKYKEKAKKVMPDLIITHVYRHYYATKAVKIARKLGIPCILVTHAPFLERKLRSWKLNAAVFLYDKFIGRNIINKYAKIFAIAKWEIPHLLALSADKNRVEYVPNGIPVEFFKIKIRKPENKVKKILFFGRIAPVKNLEVLIKAFTIVKKQFQNIELNLIGPAEENYKKNLKDLAKQLNVQVNFSPPIYDLKEKINLIDSADIFVLPSKREAMPCALIEAMARKKLVISSRTEGGKEIVEDGKTGLLFDIENEHQLAAKIIFVLDKKNKYKIAKLQENALHYVRQFSWEEVIKKIDKNIKEVLNIN